MATDDSALVKRVLAGNKAAFGPLIDRHWPRAMRLALRQLGDLGDAEDVVQDAFLQAMLGLHTLRTPDRFGAWLLGIVSNLCRMRWRTRKDHEVLEKWENTILLPDSSGSAGCTSPEAMYETRESYRLLLAALATLPVEQQQAIRLHYMEGLPLSEISLLEKASVGAVKVRLHRARTRLRHALGGETVAARNLITHKDKEFYMIESTGQNDNKANGDSGTIFPLIPTRDIVVFPHMTVPLYLGRPKSIKAVEEAIAQKTQLFLAAQRDAAENDPVQADLYPVGTLASVSGHLYLPDGSLKLLVTGERRGRLLHRREQDDFLLAEVEEIEELGEQTPETRKLVLTAQSRFQQYLQDQKRPQFLSASLAISVARQAPDQLTDTIVPALKLTLETQQILLETLDPIERLQALLVFLPPTTNEEAFTTQTDTSLAEQYLHLHPKGIEGMTEYLLMYSYFSGWTARDIDLLLNSVTDDFLFNERPMTMSNGLKGKPRFQEYLTTLFTAFPDLTKSIRSINACETRVWIEWTMTGTHQGEFCGIAPTQRKIKIQGASVFKIQDSKISSERLYWDMGDLLRQLGQKD